MSKSIDETISENFFKLLEERNITQTEFADTVGIDRTLLSKWKNGKAKMTVEQINAAAKYFNVSVDYLYGSEKKLDNNELVELAKANKFIETKKKYIVKKYTFLYKYKDYIAMILTMATILTTISFFLFEKSEFWTYLIFSLAFLFFPFDYDNKEFESSPHIEINYNDRVYYTIDNDTNLYYKKDIILYTLKIIILIPTFLWLIISKKAWSNVIQIPLLIMLVLSLLISIIELPKNKLSNKVADFIKASYGSIRFGFIVSTIILCFSIILLIEYKDFLLIIFAALSVITSLLSLILESKKYKDYYLVVKQADGIKKVV